MRHLLALLLFSGPILAQAPDFDIPYGPHQPYMRSTVWVPLQPNGSLVVYNAGGGFLNREPLTNLGPFGINTSLKEIEIVLGELLAEGFTIASFGLSGAAAEAYDPNPGQGTFRPFNSPEYSTTDVGKIWWYDECAAVGFTTARTMAEKATGLRMKKVFFWGISAGSMTSLPLDVGEDTEKYGIYCNAPLWWLSLLQDRAHTNTYLPKAGTQEPISILSDASLQTQFQASPGRFVDTTDAILWGFNFPVTVGDYGFPGNPSTFNTLAEIHDGGPAYYFHLLRNNPADEFWNDDESDQGLQRVRIYVDQEVNSKTGVRSRPFVRQAKRWILERAEG